MIETLPECFAKILDKYGVHCSTVCLYCYVCTQVVVEKWLFLMGEHKF